MEYVNRYKIPYVAVIGGDEVAAGKVMLRDMTSGAQDLMTIEQVIAKLTVR